MTADVATGQTTGVDPQRTKTIAALFELALLLEQNPDLPVPYELTKNAHLTIHLMSDPDPRAALARIVRMLPGPVEKSVWGPETQQYFDATAKIGGEINVQVTAYRDQVCERVVTGTREVTKKIPDPNITVPVVEVTETVEDVEWICGPLMREQVSQ